MLSAVINSKQSAQQINFLFERSFAKLNNDFNSSNQSELLKLRQEAKDLAKEFPMYGLQVFFERWGDHIYDHGMKIKDPEELQKFTTSIGDDLNHLHDQVDNWVNKDIIPLSGTNSNYKY